MKKIKYSEDQRNKWKRMQSKGWLSLFGTMKILARCKKILFASHLGAYRVRDKLEEQKEKKGKRNGNLNLQGTEPGSCID